ncbi:MAG: sensor histidine kinase [Chloroflexales bacterium]|nr:sensor histidine kinase [Chloroflexales bacterium]
MLQGWVIVLASLAYLGVLFAIAYYGDKRADAGRSIISNPYVYALSMAVYCTSWTFYGSVGRAASGGLGFLPIYIGPTLMAILWWVVLRKIIRISKTNRITSIADLIVSRYGKSQLLGGLVTIIAVVGIVPYISLQLKAVSNTFTILIQYPEIVMHTDVGAVPLLQDTALYVALLLATFTILFGTRHIDATERHEGMVAAIAFESLVKLLAFLAVGLFVTFGIYQGASDLFQRAMALPEVQELLTFNPNTTTFANWAWLTFLSMFAIMFLPRQFQVAVVENVDEKHLNKAVWLFPLYLVAINIFVMPITLGGLLHFAGSSVDADIFVLTLPMAERQEWLALLVFIGGLSAATGMVIVETIALSIMVSNDLVMPVLLRLKQLRLNERRDLSGLLLAIRRGTILVVLLLGFLYFRAAGEAQALVEIGLVSFAAVAQFAPIILGGIYWKDGNHLGALCGLSAGFLIWVYTLLLPSFAQSGWLPISLLDQGPLGIDLLRPTQLFGLSDMDQITHGLFWSMLFNIGCYAGVSLISKQSVVERSQAVTFVDIFKRSGDGENVRFWRGTASVDELRTLIGRFLGPERADEALIDYARRHGMQTINDLTADADLVHFAETLLAGTIGAASARVMVSSVVKEEPLGLDEVMHILDETSQVIAYSHQLEQKSRELEVATAELRAANAQLQELDRLKDDFISTVTHELRTPLTSIRAFSEILYDNPDLEVDQRSKFLNIIVKESERLTRLINQVLDLAKIESGNVEWQISEVDLGEIIEDSLVATSQIFNEKRIQLDFYRPPSVPVIEADRDRLMQVLLNLLANAAKFCDKTMGHVAINLRVDSESLRVDINDNGPGISSADQRVIFDKFRQVGNTLTDKPHGTGLGLPISQHIITHFGGKLWVESTPGVGATFSFTLPLRMPLQYGDNAKQEDVGFMEAKVG